MSKIIPKAIVIVGPTGSGKTDLSLHLARIFGGEILSADSRTIYKGMDIGTAKPKLDLDAEQKPLESIRDLFSEKPYIVDGIPHWGFNLVTPDERYDVSTYAEYAKRKLRDMRKREQVPFVVGGSGLYVQAIVDNPNFSEVEPNSERREALGQMPLEDLQKRLQQIDPEAFELIDIANPRRIIRAIEVIEATGEPWSAQQKKGDPYVNTLQIGVEVDREELYERLDARVDQMIAEGLVNEVRSLRDMYGCEVPGMTGIGYRQICTFLNGEMKLRDAIELLKRDTRHYAKRQMTWFKRDLRIVWVKTKEEAHALARDFLHDKK